MWDAHDKVDTVLFSPSGENIISTSEDDKIVRIWDVSRGIEKLILEGHKGGIRSVFMTSDNETIVTGSLDQSMGIWDAASGANKLLRGDAKNRMWPLSLSPDGRTLALHSDSDAVYLWDLRSGTLRHTFVSRGFVRKVAFSPDSQTIAIVQQWRTGLWHVWSGEYIKELWDYADSIEFSQDGRTIAIELGSTHTVVLLDTCTGACKQKLNNQEHLGELVRYEDSENLEGCPAMVFSPDCKKIAWRSKVWDVSTGAVIWEIKRQPHDMQPLVFSPDGTKIATPALDGQKDILLVPLSDVTRTHRLKGHTAKVLSVAFSSDGARLASGSSDKTVRLWDISSEMSSVGSLIPRAGFSKFAGIVFSPDGKLLALDTGRIVLWDVTIGRIKHEIERPTQRSIVDMKFSRDGQIFAVAFDQETIIRLWSVQTGVEKRWLKGHRKPIRAICISPNSEWIASNSEDETIRIWNATTGKCEHKLDDEPIKLGGMAFSLGSKMLASVGSDMRIQLWDVADGYILRTFNGRRIDLRPLLFAPSGTTAAVAKADGKNISLWDMSPDSTEHVLCGHTAAVNAVTFSPDGRTLASGSEDKTIRIWDATTGLLKDKLKNDSCNVDLVAFSSNGLLIAAGSQTDGTILLWHVATRRQEHKLTAHKASLTTLAFSPDSKLIGAVYGDRKVLIWNASTGTVERELDDLQALEHASDILHTMHFEKLGQIIQLRLDHQTVATWDTTINEPVRISTQCQQVTFLEFSNDNSTLRADTAIIPLPGRNARGPSKFKGMDVRLRITDNWLYIQSERALWIPPSFRTRKYEIWSNQLIAYVDYHRELRILEIQPQVWRKERE